MLTRSHFPHPVEVVENLWIPLPDGTRLAAKLWRPAEGKHPAILEYLPYRKHDGTRGRDQGMHMYLAGAVRRMRTSLRSPYPIQESGGE